MSDPDQAYTVHRTLAAFKNSDDFLAFEHSLDHVDLKVLRDLVHHEFEEPMILEYPLDEQQAMALGRMLGIELDFDRYTYFISCCAQD